jgi:hypothetical protein
MPIFLLPFDPIVLSLGVLPLLRLLLGKRMSPWLSWLAIADGIVFLVVIAIGLRRAWQADAAIRADGLPAEQYQWHSGWGAAHFLEHLSLLVRTRGWRVLATEKLDGERVALLAVKENTTLAVLCEKPEREAVQADLQTLAGLRAKANASRAVLVSRSRHGPAGGNPPRLALARPRPGGEPTVFFRFDDLPNLDEALGLTL